MGVPSAIGAGIKYGAKSVTTAASALVTTGKKSDCRAPNGILVKVVSTAAGICYVGGDASVTSATGFPLSAGESLTVPIDDPARIFVIASAGTIDLRYIYI